jgi:hypothetical protein
LKAFSYNMLAKCLRPVAISFPYFPKSTFALDKSTQIYYHILQQLILKGI